MLIISGNEKFPQKNIDEFIDYIYRNCDKFSFHLPNYEQNKCKGKMKMTEEYQQYLDKNKDLLEEINPYVIEKYVGKNYYGMKYSYACHIYIVNLYNGFKKYLKKYNDLYIWQFPDLPEDLCFFKKNSNKCWLRITAHEKDCIIYKATEADKKILDECGLIAVEFPD